MGRFSLYDEKSLEKQIRLQRDHAWDLEESIGWDRGIDLNRPFVPLDEHALFFPGASPEQRLAISQMMGLIIAQCICSMEETLLKLKKTAFDSLHEKFPVNPEFVELGELFFEEEEKHSRAFRRYLHLFCEKTSIDEQTLCSLLPTIEKSRAEHVLRKDLEMGGQSFWWVVASVEQEFLHLYFMMKPFKESLDPLYYELHQKHFEEEARHAPFPYLVLELLQSRQSGFRSKVQTKMNLVLAQALQTLWAVDSLGKVQKVKKLAQEHPLFEALASAFPLLENQPLYRVLWKMMTVAPYTSSLLNPHCHKQIKRVANKQQIFTLPFPGFAPSKLVKY